MDGRTGRRVEANIRSWLHITAMTACSHIHTALHFKVTLVVLAYQLKIIIQMQTKGYLNIQKTSENSLLKSVNINIHVRIHQSRRYTINVSNVSLFFSLLTGSVTESHSLTKLKGLLYSKSVSTAAAKSNSTEASKL
jgi:hypothetical protein